MLLFKTCPLCHFIWANRHEFMSDENIVLLGHQADTGKSAHSGWLTFTHNTETCGTSFIILIKAFKDINSEEFTQRSDEGNATCSSTSLRMNSEQRYLTAIEFKELVQTLESLPPKRRQTQNQA